MTTNQIIAVPALLVALGILFQLVRRPLLGLGVLLCGTILFDQFLAGPDSFFHVPNVYNNLNVSLRIPGLVINPPEILLSLLLVGWAVQAFSGRLPGRPLRLISILGICWCGAVAFAALWGVQNGGNGKIGLWLLRPVVYFMLTAFVTYQLVRSPRQAKWLLVAMLVCIGLRAVWTSFLWWQHHRDGEYWESYVAHENTSIALYLVWMALGALVMTVPRALLNLLLLLLPITVMAVIFNDRRINFLTAVIGCTIMFVAMPRIALARRSMWLAGGAICLLLYVTAAMVMRENALTRPVKGVLAGLRTEVRGHYTDSSSEYRKMERYDLIHTIRAYPVLGAGLGVAYLQPIPLPDLGYDYYELIPHNQVLGTHALMGPQGYFMLLLFKMALFMQMLSYYRRLRTDWHRLLALVAACSVVNWLLVGYYDIQLFYFRNSLFMGVVVALPAALMHWQDEQDFRTREAEVIRARARSNEHLLA